MTRHLSLAAFQLAVQAVDPTAVCFSYNSPSDLVRDLTTPPSGKVIARVEGGMNNVLAIFNATGPNAILSLITADVKGGQFATESGAAFSLPALGTPVEVRQHNSPSALEAYLKLTDPAATVTVYADESLVNPAGAFRLLCQPARFVKITGALGAAFLFIRDFQNGFITVKK